MPEIIENAASLSAAVSTAASEQGREVLKSSDLARSIPPGDWLSLLWQKHSAGLLLYARQKSSAAEDLVQMAFLSLARQTIAPTDPATWLYRVVRNHAVSHGGKSVAANAVNNTLLRSVRNGSCPRPRRYSSKPNCARH